MEDAPASRSEELDVSEIPETDILFECPHCGKSLSIDQRGAGLVIRCTQCGNQVTVPIPDGMEIEDFDATPEELSSQLLYSRQTLARAQSRLKELEAENIALKDSVERAAGREAELVRKVETVCKIVEDSISAGRLAAERLEMARSILLPELSGSAQT